MKRIRKSETNEEAYDHHIITLGDYSEQVRLAVDVFDDGSVHIYDADDRTGDCQLSLLPAEVSRLAQILQKAV